MRSQDGALASFAPSVLNLLTCLHLFGVQNGFVVAAALYFHSVFIAQAIESISLDFCVPASRGLLSVVCCPPPLEKTRWCGLRLRYYLGCGTRSIFCMISLQ